MFVVPDLLGVADLEEVGAGDATRDLCGTFLSKQVAHLIEELVKRAVDVEGGSQGSNVLDLNHNLSPDSWNVEFLDQVCGSVQSDNHVL